jgi:hypothetical protein
MMCLADVDRVLCRPPVATMAAMPAVARVITDWFHADACAKINLPLAEGASRFGNAALVTVNLRKSVGATSEMVMCRTKVDCHCRRCLTS